MNNQTIIKLNNMISDLEVIDYLKLRGYTEDAKELLNDLHISYINIMGGNEQVRDLMTQFWNGYILRLRSLVE